MMTFGGKNNFSRGRDLWTTGGEIPPTAIPSKLHPYCNGNKVDLLNRYMLLRQVICSQMQLTAKKTIKDKSSNGPWILGELAALIHSR